MTEMRVPLCVVIAGRKKRFHCLLRRAFLPVQRRGLKSSPYSLSSSHDELHTNILGHHDPTVVLLVLMPQAGIFLLVLV